MVNVRNYQTVTIDRTLYGVEAEGRATEDPTEADRFIGNEGQEVPGHIARQFGIVDADGNYVAPKKKTTTRKPAAEKPAAKSTTKSKG